MKKKTDQEKAEAKTQAERDELYRLAEKCLEEFTRAVKGIWPPGLIPAIDNETDSLFKVTLKNGLTFKFNKIYRQSNTSWIEIGYAGDEGPVIDIMVSEICVVQTWEKP